MFILELQNIIEESGYSLEQIFNVQLYLLDTHEAIVSGIHYLCTTVKIREQYEYSEIYTFSFVEKQ